jgi:hypothetical protein
LRGDYSPDITQKNSHFYSQDESLNDSFLAECRGFFVDGQMPGAICALVSKLRNCLLALGHDVRRAETTPDGVVPA